MAAVDGQYIDELRSAATNTIDKSIPEILQHLFDNFSDVTTHDVMQQEEKVRNFYWNIVEPPMVFFHAIDELQLLSKAAGVPKTQQQLTNLGLDIIQKKGRP